MSEGEKGLKRIEDLIEELGRIGKKIEIAIEHGSKPNVINRLNGDAKKLRDRIGEAAVAEARREIDCVEREADRIKNGEPPSDGRHPGNSGSMPVAPADGCCCCKGGGGGGGGGAGGRAATPVCVYVRGATKVWAWNRFTRAWDEFDAGAPLIKVELIPGGILALSARRAALFDCVLSRWLPEQPFSGSEPLVDGAAA